MGTDHSAVDAEWPESPESRQVGVVASSPWWLQVAFGSLAVVSCLAIALVALASLLVACPRLLIGNQIGVLRTLELATLVKVQEFEAQAKSGLANQERRFIRERIKTSLPLPPEIVAEILLVLGSPENSIANFT
jgi:hypothetical protein